MAQSLWVLDQDCDTIPIPTNTNLIQYPGIALLGQSNPPFFNTWYQKINLILYIGQYRIRDAKSLVLPVHVYTYVPTYFLNK
jgi:hypothetical protein